MKAYEATEFVLDEHPTCEATVYASALHLDDQQCGNDAIGVCHYCEMQYCGKHGEDGYCKGTDCREEAAKEVLCGSRHK